MQLPNEIPYIIEIEAADLPRVEAEELANFIRDLVFLHDRLWIIASKTGEEYPLNAGYFFLRNGRPIPKDQRLELNLIRKESPLTLGLILTGAALGLPSVWVFFQILRGALLLPGERRIQALQEAKLRKELGTSEPSDARVTGTDAEESLQALDGIYRENVSNGNLPGRQPDVEITVLRRDVERIGEHGFRITEVRVKQTLVVKRVDEEDRS